MIERLQVFTIERKGASLSVDLLASMVGGRDGSVGRTGRRKRRLRPGCQSGHGETVRTVLEQAQESGVGSHCGELLDARVFGQFEEVSSGIGPFRSALASVPQFQRGRDSTGFGSQSFADPSGRPRPQHFRLRTPRRQEPQMPSTYWLETVSVILSTEL